MVFMEIESPSPESAVQLAELVVQIARNSMAVELDYSAESLRQVDEMVLGFRNEGQTAQTMNETIFLLGCYLGEVIVRNHGGVWKRAEETAFGAYAEPGMLVIEMPNGIIWNPIGKAFKLLENGEEDSLAFFIGVVGAKNLAEEAAKLRTMTK